VPSPKLKGGNGSKTRNCFINCPFDAEYLPLFHAMIFTLVYCEFRPRCALELDNSGDVRISKIKNIISECRYGVHDISRTEIDSQTKLPRFNMPLELGLFLGAQHYGGAQHDDKYCLILDRTSHRFQKFISDIAGQDIRAHDDTITGLIRQLRNWIKTCLAGVRVPGEVHIEAHYGEFRRELPRLATEMGLTLERMEYSDYVDIVAVWIDTEVRP
jgi:hypothetical protein